VTGFLGMLITRLQDSREYLTLYLC
jgi:hypothetical protein